MEKIKFKLYEKRPCKFVFRSGKQVFGVVWEEESEASPAYYFASNGEFQKKKKLTNNERNIIGYNFKLEDLIYAELL